MDAIQKTPLFEQNFVVLMPDRPDKDQYSRLLFFLDWLDSQKIPWHRPALKDYKYYLLNDRTRPDAKTGAPRPARLSPATANTHIATIRGRYMALLRDNNIRQLLYDSLPSDLPAVSDRKAFVDEILLRLKNDLYFDEEKEVTI